MGAFSLIGVINLLNRPNALGWEAGKTRKNL